MTARAVGCLVAATTFLVCGFSIGGRIYYLLAFVFYLLIFLALAGVLWTAGTLHITQSADKKTALRGEEALLTLDIRHFCFLPVTAPILLCVSMDGKTQERAFDVPPFGAAHFDFPFTARHVGCFGAGVSEAQVRDCFGFFCIKKNLRPKSSTVMVLPKVFSIDKMPVLPRDEGNPMQNRTTEDVTSPEDVRAYRPGDPMKKMHWKLSYTKRELLVRRFELPAPPDTLVLLDCSAPVGAEEHEDGALFLRDALCETTLSAAEVPMRGECPVRVPLYGKNPSEFHSDKTGRITLLQEMLASQDFDGEEKFSRILQLELRRMRKTGATVVVTSCLDARVTESLIQMRAMGPAVRLYLVTFTPEKEDYLPYVARLQNHLVEVCYVTPAD